MLEDFRLKVFDEVIKAGSFTRAARNLGITQPAVSQNISELEKMLGGQLFDRSVKGVSALTEKGREFKKYSDQILYWYKAAENVFEENASNVTPPAIVEVDAETSLEIYSSQGDVHIKVLKGQNQH